MGDTTKIEWCDKTFNPWVGCQKISPACDHCYAESWAKRTGDPNLWDGERRRTTPANWRKPVKWNLQAAELGVRYRVFCASLADVFDNVVPDEWRADLWDLILATQNLDWLLLSKRIGNADHMVPWHRLDVPPWPNVWLGSTVVNQHELERDLPKLLAVPARVHFLSCEPLLGPLDLRYVDAVGLHWVIAGGESGCHARAMDADWCHELAAQCDKAGIAFFMKQGSAANWPSFKDFASFPDALRIREYPIPISHNGGGLYT